MTRLDGGTGFDSGPGFDGGPGFDSGPGFDGGPRFDSPLDPCAAVECPPGTDCLTFTCNPFTGACDPLYRSEGTLCDDCPAGFTECSTCDDAGSCRNRCGDGIVDPSAGEECEPTDDSACPGECLTTDCTCDAPAGFFEDFETGTLRTGWTSAAPAWSVTSTTPLAGTYSARSSAIGHSGTTSLTRTLTFATAGTVSFRYAVSSESCCDFLTFAVDGVSQMSWSGAATSTFTSTTISAGSHTLRWTYSKDSSVVSGSDSARIDDVSAPTAM